MPLNRELLHALLNLLGQASRSPMRRGARLLLMPCLAWGSAHAQARCPAGGIGFVRAPAVFSQLTRYAARDSELTVFVDMYRTELSRQQAVLDSAVNAYQDKSVLLTATGVTGELAKLRDQKAQVQARIDDAQQVLAAQRQRLLQPIEMGVQAEIDTVRTELGCALILDVGAGSGIVSVNKGLDLTQRVVDRIRTRGDTAVFGPPLVAANLQRP